MTKSVQCKRKWSIWLYIKVFNSLFFSLFLLLCTSAMKLFVKEVKSSSWFVLPVSIKYSEGQNCIKPRVYFSSVHYTLSNKSRKGARIKLYSFLLLPSDKKRSK